MSTFVYDTAVLIAADRNEKRTWIDHSNRLDEGSLVLVPAPVVAQVSRSARQVQLRRFLVGCTIVPFGEQDAHEAGQLLRVARTSDIVDASVVTLAIRHIPAAIVTSDKADIGRLVIASGQKVAIEDV